jgi:DNA-directed RNA polymerase subunit RPC12/RpoP
MDELVVYACPNCGKRLHTARGAGNRKARCPACGEVHIVPGEEDPFAVGGTEGVDVPAGGRSEPASPFEPFEDAARAAQGPTRRSKPPPRQDSLRRCLRCGRQTHAVDAWVEVVCSACGAVIPAVAGSGSHGRTGDEEQSIRETADRIEARAHGEPVRPSAAPLLTVVAWSLYAEGAVVGAVSVCVLVLLTPQAPVALVPALAGLLCGGFLGLQGQQIARRSRVFRVICMASEGALLAGGLVMTALAATKRIPTPPTALTWGGILVALVLLAGFRAYVLLHHARALFGRTQET